MITADPVSVAALLALGAAVQLQVRRVEEPYLLDVHGAEYGEYCARAGRFLPGIGRLVPSQERSAA